MTPDSPARNQEPDVEDVGWRHFPKPPLPEGNDVNCFLAYMEGTYNRISSDGMLKKQIVQVGTGRELVIGSFMTVHFRAYFFDTQKKLCKEPFVSTWDRDDLDEGTLTYPMEYRFMMDKEMEILHAGVNTMKVGETANFVASGFFVDGLQGWHGRPIADPSKDTVFVQIAVLQGLKATRVQKILHGDIRDQSRVSLSDIYEAVLEWKKRGDAEYRKRNCYTALDHFQHGFAWVEGNDAILPHDVRRFKDIQYSLLNRMTACFLLLKKFKKIIDHCDRALLLPSRFQGVNETILGKIYYRFAMAQCEFKQYENAMDSISRAKALLPRDFEVAQLHQYMMLRGVDEQESEGLKRMWKIIQHQPL